MFVPVPEKVFNDVRTISFYNCPLLFRCTDNKNDEYIICIVEDEENFSSWVAARITDEYMERLIENNILVNSFYFDNEIERSSRIKCTFNGKNKTIEVWELNEDDDIRWDYNIKVSQFLMR